MQKPRSLTVRREPDGVYTLAGEFDLVTVETFEAARDAFLEGEGPLVLDVAEVLFLDSTGLRSVVSLSERLAGRELVLRRPQGNVLHTILVSGVDGRNRIRVER